MPILPAIPPCTILTADYLHRKKREAITIADFEEAARKTGREIGPGSAIVCWTGVDKDWQQPGFLTERPFVPVTTAQWLLDRKIVVTNEDAIRWTRRRVKIREGCASFFP